MEIGGAAHVGAPYSLLTVILALSVIGAVTAPLWRLRHQSAHQRHKLRKSQLRVRLSPALPQNRAHIGDSSCTVTAHLCARVARWTTRSAQMLLWRSEEEEEEAVQSYVHADRICQQSCASGLAKTGGWVTGLQAIASELPCATPPYLPNSHCTVIRQSWALML